MAERGQKDAVEHLKKFSDGNCEMYDIRRDDPILVEAVETLREEANGFCAKLTVEEVDLDIHSYIRNYDGKESLELPIFYH